MKKSKLLTGTIFILIFSSIVSLRKIFSNHDVLIQDKLFILADLKSTSELLNLSIKEAMLKPVAQWDNLADAVRNDRESLSIFKNINSKNPEVAANKIPQKIITKSNEYYEEIANFKEALALYNVSKSLLPVLFYRAAIELDTKNNYSPELNEVFQNLMSDTNLYINAPNDEFMDRVKTLNGIFAALAGQNEIFLKIKLNITQLLESNIKKIESLARLEQNPKIELMNDLGAELMLKLQNIKTGQVKFKIVGSISIYFLIIILLTILYQYEKEKEKNRKRMADELEMAKVVQATLFPKEKFQSDNLEISGYYESASECGGDWWFYNKIGEDYYFCIGDATGHGAPAALITSAARSTFAILEQNQNMSTNEMMRLLNRSIYETSKGRMMMTFFLAKYSPSEKKLSYTNASHDPPFLVKSSNKKEINLLDKNIGSRLGESPLSEYIEVNLDIPSDETLFFYTDGLTELKNANGNQLGLKRLLREVLKLNSDKNDLNDITSSLRNFLREISMDAPLEDDLTYFFVNFSNSEKPNYSNR